MPSVWKNQQFVIDPGERRKRLGQYFTGSRLARLLVATTHPTRVRSVLDPMCGTGDMLRAAADFDSKLELTGIEIDEQVLESARARLELSKRAKLIRGNAFSPVVLEQLGLHEFDLVITNPPYVRYQSLRSPLDDPESLNASKVRRDLLGAANFLLSDHKDKLLFSKLIQSYSGLSDLAVPALILCAMLTKVGGTLALVVPESWLSRDYAQIIQYVLLRWFKIRFVLEDANASWFPDALVKTTLLVAERIPRKTSVLSWADEIYIHAHISANAGNDASVVGNVFPNSHDPEGQFAEQLDGLMLEHRSIEMPIWSARPVRLSDKADNLKRSVGHKQWFSDCEESNAIGISGIVLPIDFRNWLGSVDISKLTRLDQEGISVGQGLRTGANSFFYVELVREVESFAEVSPNKIFGLITLKVPLRLLRPVLHRQSDLPSGYQIEPSSLKVRVLLLERNRMEGDIRNLIDVAQATEFRGKLIPDLSAVKTNIKPSDLNEDPFSGWYVLPPLAPRHVPILLIPRVNSTSPRTYLNAKGVVVDANFSTMWLRSSSRHTAWSLVALLNSTWAVASMELLGSVMGGGALKLEATHLNKMALPRLTDGQMKELNRLGHSLVTTPTADTLRLIDETVLETLFGRGEVPDKLNQLRLILQNRRTQRMTRI